MSRCKRHGCGSSRELEYRVVLHHDERNWEQCICSTADSLLLLRPTGSPEIFLEVKTLVGLASGVESSVSPVNS